MMKALARMVAVSQASLAGSDDCKSAVGVFSGKEMTLRNKVNDVADNECYGANTAACEQAVAGLREDQDEAHIAHDSMMTACESACRLARAPIKKSGDDMSSVEMDLDSASTNCQADRSTNADCLNDLEDVAEALGAVHSDMNNANLALHQCGDSYYWWL